VEMAETFRVGAVTRHDQNEVHIPIILRNQTLGVVRLRKREEAGSWSNEEIELMDNLVDQLETALETARLYSDTQRQAARVRLTQDVTDKLHRSLDMDTLMQTLLQEISAALGATGAFVQLSTPTAIPDSANSQKIRSAN
jgi:GAF domain-containing protein